MIKAGEVVYFKRARTSTKRSAQDVSWTGFGFGIILGNVPPFAKDPDAGQIFRQLGTVGLLTFDDVGEFLGNEAQADCVKKFMDKYYGKEAEAAAPVAEAPPDRKLGMHPVLGAPFGGEAPPGEKTVPPPGDGPIPLREIHPPSTEHPDA